MSIKLYISLNYPGDSCVFYVEELELRISFKESINGKNTKNHSHSATLFLLKMTTSSCLLNVLAYFNLDILTMKLFCFLALFSGIAFCQFKVARNDVVNKKNGKIYCG